MTMQMYWVNVVARISHSNPISLALLKVKGRWCWFSSHRICRTVNRPAIEALLCGVFLRKGHLDCLVSLGSRRTGLGETRVAPPELRRSSPLWLPSASGILHNDSHSMPAIPIIKIAEKPHPRLRHVHQRGNALRCTDPQNRNRCRIRNQVSIKCENLKRMPRQSQA